MVKFSQEYKKPDLALNIIKAMGDAGVVRDGLYRALFWDFQIAGNPRAVSLLFN